MNQCSFIGHIGQDPKVNTVNGKSVANFSIGVNKGYGDNKSTLWVNCSLWEKPNLNPYLTKGAKVYVSGELDLRSYEKDGVTKSNLELRVFNLELLGSSQPATTGIPTSSTATPVPNQDLPF